MIVLAPLISGKENNEDYLEAITKSADKIILLQVIDKDFMNRTSTAMGEVMQFRSMMNEVRKKIGQKRKKCEEITEWGSADKKISAIAILQKADKTVMMEQKNKFFEDLLKELKKNKVKVEVVKLKEED